MILTIRSDTPIAELSLVENGEIVATENWGAGRELSNQLLGKVIDLLKQSSVDGQDLDGIVVFAGPGSFTGLRISHAVANALASSWEVSITSAGGDDWIAEGVTKIANGENQKIVIPDYGSEANITQPRK